MKVAYFGHFCDGRGWATASENYVRALQSVGVDVACRPVIINGQRQPSKDLMLLFDKSLDGATYAIQHTIPTHWDYSDKVKNIGLFVTETNTIKYTHWENKIKCMDQVWVPNKQMQMELLPIQTQLVPHAADISVYNKQYPRPKIDGIESKYVFYFVGENIRRKRINAILHAYNREFDINDNVVLIIKTGRDGQSAQETADHINKENIAVKKALRLYAKRDLYPEIVIIPTQLPIEHLYGLHQAADCFVNATFGDAWNQPCFDAFAFGNSVISPFIGGMADYLKGGDGVCSVAWDLDSCFGADAFLPDLHTGRELWCHINIEDLCKNMRGAYDNFCKDKSDKNLKLAERYSYENIGRIMLEYLNE